MALTAAELVEDLASRYPDDAEDLRDALKDLHRQKLSTVERLARLNDAQWQRLALPMGIEALLRDEVAIAVSSASSPAPQPSPPMPQPVPPLAPAAAAAYPRAYAAVAEAPSPAPEARTAAATPPARFSQQRVPDPEDDELDIEPLRMEGLHNRRQRGGANSGPTTVSKKTAQSRGLLDSMDLSPPADLDQLWENLLEDCLPPDKRAALQDTWSSAKDDHERYMMFLEYSSYLRKPEISEEEKAERKKELEPLMRELGITQAGVEEQSFLGSLLMWLLIVAALFAASYVYYTYSSSDPLQELQGL